MLPSLLFQCYQARLPVSAAKKADLVKLCKKQIIPEDCHKYNNNLTTTRTEKDATPAPAFGEKEADTDAEWILSVSLRPVVFLCVNIV